MPETSFSFNIRPAGPEDAGTLVRLIRDLAEYERLSHEVVSDPDALAKHLSPDSYPRCEALLAESEGQAIGFALYFHNYSTFLTRWGIYLEDVYVKPEYRGHGVGFALLEHVAAIAVSRNCGRMEWSVLNWNETANQFYRRLGARPMDEWTVMRLTGETLHRLGTGKLRNLESGEQARS